MQKFKEMCHFPGHGLKVQGNEVSHAWRKEMAQTMKRRSSVPNPNVSCNIKFFMPLEEVEKPGLTYGTPLHFPYDSI